MNTIIEKIRAEVNRMKKEKPARNAIGAICGEETVVDASKLLSRLSDLEKEEKPTTAEGLYDFMKNRSESLHFHDDFEIAAYKKGVVDGAKWQKDQLMKEAVEGWVAIDKRNNCYLYRRKPKRSKSRALFWTTEDCCFLPITAKMFPGFKWEDEPKKVKLIIVKED